MGEREHFEQRRKAIARMVGTGDRLLLSQKIRLARAQRERTRAIFRKSIHSVQASWQSAGPDNVPGRITCLARDPSDVNLLYAGAAAGGVFKSEDGGATWYPLWSGQPSLAIGGLAVSPSSDRQIYAATGEWEGDVGAANNHFAGAGVFRSDDYGETWKGCSPISSLFTSAVAIDPSDSRCLYVAGDTALHRSRDGGVTWDVSGGYVNGVFDGVVTDVAIDPAESNRIYICVDNQGVWRSLDAGNSWKHLRGGIASGGEAPAPKIALGLYGVHKTQFVAVKTGQRVFTSVDGGELFAEQALCDEEWSAFYAWATVIAVDPEDEDLLYGGHASLFRSTNGGSSWTKIGGYGKPPVHADQQALLINPRERNRVLVATDGGVFESLDFGVKWKARNIGLLTTQCWTVGVSQTDPLSIIITTQDNSCYQLSTGASFSAILPVEGGWVYIDPHNSAVYYADTWFYGLKKSLNAGKTWQDLGINTDASNSVNLAVAPNSPKVVLAIRADGIVVRSNDGGLKWTPVLDTKKELVTAVAFCPSDANIAYVASYIGRAWGSRDGGKNWNEIETTALPHERVHAIASVANQPDRFYLGFAAMGIRQLWRCELGAGGVPTWKDATGSDSESSLPDLAITGLVVDPTDSRVLYAANLLGIYQTRDEGQSWLPFDSDLPNSWVSGLVLRVSDRTLYASTMGRGLYRVSLK